MKGGSKSWERERYTRWIGAWAQETGSGVNWFNRMVILLREINGLISGLVVLFSAQQIAPLLFLWEWVNGSHGLACILLDLEWAWSWFFPQGNGTKAFESIGQTIPFASLLVLTLLPNSKGRGDLSNVKNSWIVRTILKEAKGEVG